MSSDRSGAVKQQPSPERTRVGNFVFGLWAGDVRCRYGHEVRLFNISRGHWVACDECRTYTFIGSNLWSSWRGENEVVWRKNNESVRGYRCIEREE